MNSYTSPFISYYPQNQTLKDVEQHSVPYQIYFIHSQPYVSYAVQPEILLPLNMMPLSEQNSRFISEIVGAASQAACDIAYNATNQEIQKLENSIQKLEQETVQKIKTSCFSNCY